MRQRSGIFRCFYCDQALSRAKKTHDHLQPKSRNGSNKPHNIVNACRQCNCLKGQLTLQEFRVVMAYRHGLVGEPEFKFPGEVRRQQNESR
jgi:5-methylcytosine-specific restriction endonuclease McrA